MSFTEYLPQLRPAQYPEEALLAQLGKALRGHLHRLGLWDQPPEFLGYPDFADWRAAFQNGDAAADPTLDCYLEAVVRRYGSLMEQLHTRKTNIDGLIHLNIKRFILKRQKDHDPVGYAVFKNLEAALQDLIAQGRLRSFQPDPHGPEKLRNQTRLTFGPESSGAVESPPATRETIEAALDGDPAWTPTLPRLSKLGKGAQQLVRECLTRLPAAGVRTFRLGDLVDLLKGRARAAHAQHNRLPDQDVVAEAAGNETVRRLIRIVRPEAGYQEDREALERLLRCLRDRIAGSDLQERTREGLRRLVYELEQQADTDEEIPSWAELARRLGARRTTVWDHLERLRALAEDCRERT